MELKMKHALFSFLLLLAAVLLLGCGDTSISPVESDSHSYKLNKHSYELIKLPPKSSPFPIIFSKTKLIDGDIGGTIKIKASYVATDGHTVEIEGKLEVPENAFIGKVYITFTIDNEFAAASFSPELIFVTPVELDLKFEGLHLEKPNLTKGDYDFIFVNDNGNIEFVQYDGLYVDESKGKIRVDEAKLHHFSRYGFTR